MITERAELMPKRATVGSCGYDFYLPYNVSLEPGEWVTIDTGVKFDGKEKTQFDRWFMLMVPRSSLGMKYGFRLSNTVGIIDQDYRDTIKAKFTVDTHVILAMGERFMQGIIVPYGTFEQEVPPEKHRNGGIGSTGKE